MTAAPTPEGAHRPDAWRHRDFRYFWFGAFLSNVGTWMQNAAVPFVMFQLTDSSVWVGLSAFAVLFPAVILGPLAGVWADRADRRRFVFWSQVAQAVAAFALAAAWAAGLRSPTGILLLVAIGGVLFGLSMPAWQGFISDLVPRSDLPSAVSLNAMQFHGSRAVGPAIAGIVLATAGPTWAFVVNGISFVAVMVAVALVRTRTPRRIPEHRTRIRRQLAEGFSYARRHRGIATTLVLVVAVGFLGNPVVQLAPVFAERVYGVGAGAYGLLTAAFGVGAATGIWVLSRLAAVHRRSRIVVASMTVLGVALVAFGLSPTYGVGVLCVLLAGSAAVGTGTMLLTGVQLQVADLFRGRVLGVYAMVFTASYPIGALVQGWLADQIGARANEVIVGSAVLAVSAVLLVQRSRLAALDGTAPPEVAYGVPAAAAQPRPA